MALVAQGISGGSYSSASPKHSFVSRSRLVWLIPPEENIKIPTATQDRVFGLIFGIGSNPLLVFIHVRYASYKLSRAFGKSPTLTRAAEKVIRSQSCRLLLVGVIDQ